MLGNILDTSGTVTGGVNNFEPCPFCSDLKTNYLVFHMANLCPKLEWRQQQWRFCPHCGKEL